LEHANVYGNYYGSMRKDADAVISSGKSALFCVDVQGAKSIMKKFSGAVSIFVSPPSIDALRKRLEKRGKDSEEVVEARLRVAEQEMPQAKEFGFEVINDDLDEAVSETREIILSAVER
jgi:guanylate kinase